MGIQKFIILWHCRGSCRRLFPPPPSNNQDLPPKIKSTVVASNKYQSVVISEEIAWQLKSGWPRNTNIKLFTCIAFALKRIRYISVGVPSTPQQYTISLPTKNNT